MPKPTWSRQYLSRSSPCFSERVKRLGAQGKYPHFDGSRSLALNVVAKTTAPPSLSILEPASAVSW